MVNAIQGNYLGFWSVGDEYGFFSNWYKCKFVCQDITFSSSEQALMYRKAKLFKDEEIAKKILETQDPRKIKELGRKVSNFDSATWDDYKFDIMVECLLCKFGQNETLKYKLLKTKDLILVEASPLDKVWGIGLSLQDGILDEDRWKGENLLGQALMLVRDYLRSEV